METKKCSVCDEIKILSEFYSRGAKCKECTKSQQRERNKQSKIKSEKIKNDDNLKTIPKTCKKCKNVKTVGDFRINRGECLDCERKYGRQYNIDRADVRKKWLINNKERYVKKQADLYQKNKEKINARYRERYATDKCFKLHRDHKDKLRRLINNINSSEDYIGTSCELIANWLEYNFTEEMNWQNHGTVWDIDHVMPACKWDLKNQEHKNMCFDWKNLSPLDCATNRNIKRDKIDQKQLEIHYEKLRNYFEEHELDMDELQYFMAVCDERLN